MTEEQTEILQQVKERTTESCKSLGKAILDSEEYKSFIDARDKFRSDESAKQAAKKYNEAFNEYRMKAQYGIASAEDKEQIEVLKTAMLENKTLNNYYSSQDNLINFLKELNIYISNKLSFDFASLAKPAGGCCG